MTRATDPFEEYLRKKKVEMLESKFRAEAARTTREDEDDDRDPGIPSNDDPEVEARVREEAEEFLAVGQSASVELFEKLGPTLSSEKVEEIRGALEEVFEEDAPAPQTADSNAAFVSFFKQVQCDYEPPAAPPDETEDLLLVEDPSPATARGTTDIGAAAVEVSTEPDDLEDTAEIDVGERLDLAEILGPPETEEELRQRVDLLSRLVARLAAKVKLPENEIIEVLIKSGVEF